MDESLRQLGVALALILVIEGLLYALFPDAMRKLMTLQLAQPAGVMRWAGLGAAVLGVALVWVVRRSA